MPEISQAKNEDIKTDLATFIALFVHILRIVANEYEREYPNERNFVDKKSYNNPEVFISFAILYLISKESNFLNKLKYINIAKIRSLLGNDEEITQKIESIILNQNFVSEANKDTIIQEFFKKPAVIEKIVWWSESDFTFLSERLNSSELIDLDKIYLLLQKVVYAKASTKLSPSALIVKEAVMSLINSVIDMQNLVSFVYSSENTPGSDDIKQRRVLRALNDYFRRGNKNIAIGRDNPFWFVSLVYDYKSKEVFKYFFDHDNFSKTLRKEIGKILKLKE